jgi:hypothetical protein
MLLLCKSSVTSETSYSSTLTNILCFFVLCLVLNYIISTSHSDSYYLLLIHTNIDPGSSFYLMLSYLYFLMYVFLNGLTLTTHIWCTVALWIPFFASVDACSSVILAVSFLSLWLEPLQEIADVKWLRFPITLEQTNRWCRWRKRFTLWWCRAHPCRGCGVDEEFG